MELIIATGNEHKVREIRQILPENLQVRSLQDLGVGEEIPETGDTLEANAMIKARFIHDKLGCWCLAEDTGLEVSALNMAPGVNTARYGGPAKDAGKNMDKLLTELVTEDHREARFRTVIALIVDDAVHFFEGISEGSIAREPKGNAGFGYDPVFIPLGFDQSFGELPEEIKLGVSHRTRAMQKCMTFLENYLKSKSPLSTRSPG